MLLAKHDSRQEGRYTPMDQMEVATLLLPSIEQLPRLKKLL